MAKISLPSDLEDRTIAQFDELLRRGEIYYERSEPEKFIQDGFQFEFRVLPFLKGKPITAPDDPGRVGPGGPFINPRQEEVITAVGPHHRLLVNKYSVYRPMLVLPTTKFALQTDDLDEHDLTAAWAVLMNLKSPYVAFYNCGVNAGSSQGHKHMQMFPAPEHKLWPSRALSSEAIATELENVPFKHFVLRMPQYATAAHLLERYQQLLLETREALKAANQGRDYNIVFTSEWIALIPRARAEWGGPLGANALGMLGLVFVPDAAEKDRWRQLGYGTHLRNLGIALQ